MRIILMIVITLFLTACVTENQSSLNKERDVKLVLSDSKSEQRVALVIGNKDYSSLNPLKNPVNDARVIKDILLKKKFNVIYLENASQMEMEESIDKFADKLKSGNGVGLFYYAGHGMEVDGVNYLIPTDARIPSKKYVKSKSVSTDIIVTAMEEAKNRINILILDSCRSNPFGRGSSGGLAPINSATGIYVAYATAPHKVAQDGEGDNGLFTSYLVKYINEDGLKIEDVFKKVRQGVQRDSNGNQIPWSSSSILGDFYFSLPKKTSSTVITNFESIQKVSDFKNITMVNGVMYQTHPSSNSFTWNEAKEYCENLVLNGYNDWRLSSFDELININTVPKNLMKEKNNLPPFELDIMKNNILRYEKRDKIRKTFWKKINKYKINNFYLKKQFSDKMCVDGAWCLYWSSTEESFLGFATNAYLFSFGELRKFSLKKSFKPRKNFKPHALCVR